jgi:ferritin heavy chain
MLSWLILQGSHFLQDTVNRPGFAKFFLESASEERQHALKLIEYLLMRGELTATVEFDKLIDNPVSSILKNTLIKSNSVLYLFG